MTCKDCVHEKVCVIIAFPEAFENTKWEKEPCDHFQNKADFVEVVRCKDCKHWEKYENTAGAGKCKKREFSFEYSNEHTFNPITMPDFYCSYGERRDT